MFYLLGAFYFVLGNLRPQYRSVINIIQLVALFRTSLISTYGMDRILQPFMRDLNRLESVQYAILFFIIIKLYTDLFVIFELIFFIVQNVL